MKNTFISKVKELTCQLKSLKRWKFVTVANTTINRINNTDSGFKILTIMLESFLQYTYKENKNNGKTF